MTEPAIDQSWIGVDLDGTLSHYTGWIPGGGIGKPIPVMVDRVRVWLSEGRSVRIFTARTSFEGIRARAGTSLSYTAAETATIAEIQAWCKTYIGTALPVTCVKDIYMTELWDDRCVSVTPNTGCATVAAVELSQLRIKNQLCKTMTSYPLLTYSKIVGGYRVEVPIVVELEHVSTTYACDYFTVTGSTMTVNKGYVWDGASGPTLDTKSTMLASLIHDVLYQLIRMGHLAGDCRVYADWELFVCMNGYGKQHASSGMGRQWSYIRAMYYFLAVRCFGSGAAKSSKYDEYKTYTV